jgi:hypothetical protein
MTHSTQYISTPVIGYGDGLVTGQVTPSRIENNDWIVIGNFRFNVHPYRDDLGGFPVRWIETADDHRAVQPATADRELNPPTNFASYAWHIHTSQIDADIDDDGTFGKPVDVSITGPGNPNIDPNLEQKLINGEGDEFKLYDDDGELYYVGRIVGDFEGFEPLDDFGTPNAGCTRIDIKGETI